MPWLVLRSSSRSSVFVRSAQLEIAGGLRGRLAAQRKMLFYAAIAAATIKATAQMVNSRCSDMTMPSRNLPPAVAPAGVPPAETPDA